MSPEEKMEKAKALRSEADQLAKEALEERRITAAQRPLLERLTFSAVARCPCGAGLAYDPTSDGQGTPFRGPSAWDCSAILLGTAISQPGSVEHTAPLPFAFYEIKSENQPSVGGRSTRPAP